MKEIDTRREALRMLARMIARKYKDVQQNLAVVHASKYQGEEGRNEDVPDPRRNTEDRR